MRYWDSSALAALLLGDPHSPVSTSYLQDDPIITTWWGSFVECQSVIWNGHRRGRWTSEEAVGAEHRLRNMRALWQEIVPSEDIRENAARFLRHHELRAADALQLAAAMAASTGSPSGISVVTFDRRLVKAAEREGFRVITSAKDTS